jgi:hypothetical protein
MNGEIRRLMQDWLGGLKRKTENDVVGLHDGGGLQLCEGERQTA